MVKLHRDRRRTSSGPALVSVMRAAEKLNSGGNTWRKLFRRRDRLNGGTSQPVGLSVAEWWLGPGLANSLRAFRGVKSISGGEIVVHSKRPIGATQGHVVLESVVFREPGNALFVGFVEQARRSQRIICSLELRRSRWSSRVLRKLLSVGAGT